MYLDRAPAKRLHMLTTGLRWGIVPYSLHNRDGVLCARDASRVCNSSRLPVRDTTHEWRGRRLDTGIEPCINMAYDPRVRSGRMRWR